MTKTTDTSPISLLACEEGFDPIEDRLRANIRGTIEAVFKEELDGFLGRLRYGRDAEAVKGYRHGGVRRMRTSLCKDSEAVPYAAPRPRHSARAAARLSLKLSRE